MKIRHRALFLRLTLYYAVLALVLWAVSALLPGLASYFPLGGSDALLGGGTGDPFEPIEIGARQVSGLAETSLWIAAAILGAILVMVPVTWVYMATRRRDGLDQSLVETMLVLPIAVTGIVLVVQNSLALAFSLAGIVAGVRFRNTLKSSGDALFIFTSIGVGLAAGVGALEIAAVVTIAFNYTFVVLWGLDYGGGRKAQRYMRKSRKKDHHGKEDGDRDHHQPADGRD